MFGLLGGISLFQLKGRLCICQHCISLQQVAAWVSRAGGSPSVFSSRSQTNRGESSSDWRRRSDRRRGTATKPWRAGAATGTATGAKQMWMRRSPWWRPLRLSTSESGPLGVVGSEWKTECCVPGLPAGPSLRNSPRSPHISSHSELVPFRLPLYCSEFC